MLDTLFISIRLLGHGENIDNTYQEIISSDIEFAVNVNSVTLIPKKMTKTQNVTLYITLLHLCD
jgi:hypothetical protein